MINTFRTNLATYLKSNKKQRVCLFGGPEKDRWGHAQYFSCSRRPQLIRPCVWCIHACQILPRPLIAADNMFRFPKPCCSAGLVWSTAWAL